MKIMNLKNKQNIKCSIKQIYKLIRSPQKWRTIKYKGYLTYKQFIRNLSPLSCFQYFYHASSARPQTYANWKLLIDKNFYILILSLKYFQRTLRFSPLDLNKKYLPITFPVLAINGPQSWDNTYS